MCKEIEFLLVESKQHRNEATEEQTYISINVTKL